MPQAKTTKKKATGKTSSVKVGGGGVGTRVSKLNLKIVIPIVVVVAALGGFYIFRKSGASSAAPYSISGKAKFGSGSYTTYSMRSKTGSICVSTDFGSAYTAWANSYKWKIQEYVGYQWQTRKESKKMSANSNKDSQCHSGLKKGATFRIEFYNTRYTGDTHGKWSANGN